MPNDDGFSIESHCIAKCIIESCFYNMLLPGSMNANTATVGKGSGRDYCDVANSVNILVAIRWVAKV